MVRPGRAGGRIAFLASLLLTSTALATSPEQSAEAHPDARPEMQVHAAAPALPVPIERSGTKGLLVLPRLPDPGPPAMPAELEEQRRASLAPPGLMPAEPAPMASLDRIIIETPPAPAFDLSILEREKRLAEEPSPAPQQQAGPIIIERPAPPEFDLSSLRIEPPRRAEPLAPLPYRLSIAREAAKALVEPYRQRLGLRPSVADEIVAAYETRDWQSLWFKPDGGLAGSVGGLVAQLSSAGEDGLDPSRLLSLVPLSLSDLTKAEPLAEEKRTEEKRAEEKRAEIDLLLSLAAVTYAQDARGGRLEPAKLSAMLTPELFLPPAGEVLERVARAETADAVRNVLAAYNPQHEGYRALKQALARLRAEPAEETEATASTPKSAHPRAEIPSNFMEGSVLVPGQEDARVPHLRRRLGLPAGEKPVYDAALADAVREFQRANGLKPDGRIASRTRALLQDPDAPVNREQKARNAPEDLSGMLIANMERWRWLPPELGRTHIFVNIPEFRLQMMEEGARVFETRIIVGKPERQTPVFSDKMEFLVVNPSWYIPPTILRKDVLPKLAADPSYAARMGYQVIRNGRSISVRQPPGERNALGHVKFMFPNSHAVYLHDTPGRHLFRNEIRAFSSGCVRVDQPFVLAEHLLLKRQGLSERQLRAMVGSGERTIRLTEAVPVHLAYFTLSVDENGALVRKPDLYGHDLRIRRALSL
ncbi:MAG: L,D-transpeptidase family protein [Methylobacterium sp.]|nr:L,D-transpeptidase family protein [Methylobacterium sp.]MCA3607481.1 L,D-transpeptidase family protein [Methylobacterium sp.]MCA3609019.1 L,D-transpeptidase family protein [Methylobacterium sp.]MCA3617751.1 L,D-transpeptidase family protein [Methylobacterium sp.]MCA3619620.1 L,D-transpeptidase family protein [Methylobacterium sp.]